MQTRLQSLLLLFFYFFFYLFIYFFFYFFFEIDKSIRQNVFANRKKIEMKRHEGMTRILKLFFKITLFSDKVPFFIISITMLLELTYIVILLSLPIKKNI